MNSYYMPKDIYATSEPISIPTFKKPPPALPEDRFLDDQGKEIYHSHKHQEKAQQTKLADYWFYKILATKKSKISNDKFELTKTSRYAYDQPFSVKGHMIHTIDTSSSAYTESELQTMDMQQLTRVCTQVTSLRTGPILNESDR
tara:strand:+ start:603 stop:1034 length:432 start_codon:yes stop_codon:yes gene_type:complete